MVPTWSYAKAQDGVYVNLYIGSTVMLENAGGTDVEMVQETDYPWNGKVAITVKPKSAKRFAVRLRVPNRATSKLYTPTPEVGGLVSLAVNGRAVKPTIERGYAVITREWKAGDKIELELPLKPQRVTATEKIEATRGKVALRYGPLVYNVEAKDQDIAKALDMTSPLETQWRGDLLGGVTVIAGKFADGSPMLAIPNYARTNRNPELPPEAGPQAADPSLYLGPTAQRQTMQAQIPGERRAPRPVVSAVWMPKG
jgi:DUF1680 family protein